MLYTAARRLKTGLPDTFPPYLVRVKALPAVSYDPIVIVTDLRPADCHARRAQLTG
jgi:hypothetical protein